jgi:dihydroorotate dehydrogenase electron transfer subunit
VQRFAELAGVGKPLARVVPADLMHFKQYTLRNIEQVNPDLGLLHFEEGIPSCEPGQFVSVWAPGTGPNGDALGEKPFAPAVADDGRGMCLAVRAVGTLTGHLLKNLAKGDKVYVRGPYGKPFFVPSSVEPTSNFVMVGGGTGIAPLLLLAEKLFNAGVSKERIWVYLGGRSVEHVYFEEEFKAYSAHVAVATNDGSRGFQGFVTDCLKEDLPKISNGKDARHFYNCGPELMMSSAVKVQEASSFASIECSIERYMKCGVGICGVCSCDGYRTCVDGPIFGYDFIKQSEMFGKKHRAKTTKLLDW